MKAALARVLAVKAIELSIVPAGLGEFDNPIDGHGKRPPQGYWVALEIPIAVPRPQPLITAENACSRSCRAYGGRANFSASLRNVQQEVFPPIVASRVRGALVVRDVVVWPELLPAGQAVVEDLGRGRT